VNYCSLWLRNKCCWFLNCSLSVSLICKVSNHNHHHHPRISSQRKSWTKLQGRYTSNTSSEQAEITRNIPTKIALNLSKSLFTRKLLVIQHNTFSSVFYSDGVPQEHQITVHSAGTVAKCWFIPDSICLRGWHAWPWARVIAHCQDVLLDHLWDYDLPTILARIADRSEPYTALCFTEAEWLPMHVVHCRNKDFRPLLLLWPWPSYMNLTNIPWRYTGWAKMHILHQGFWKFASDKQTPSKLYTTPLRGWSSIVYILKTH